MTQRARELRSDMPLAERRLWAQLRRRNLGHRFRRQHPVGPYFLDFACVALKLGIEVDGDGHFANAASIVYDEQRTEFLVSQGWTVHRVTNLEVQQALGPVLEGIKAVAGELAASPSAPAGHLPRRGRVRKS